MHRMLPIILTLFAPATSMAGGHCFTIYDANNSITRQSPNSPIDLSNTITSQMNVRYPGQYLVWQTNADGCQELDGLAQKVAKSKNSEPIPFNIGIAKYQAVSEMDSINPDSYGGALLGSRAQGSLIASRLKPGTDVTVKAFIKDNGTFVRSYTRFGRGRR